MLGSTRRRRVGGSWVGPSRHADGTAGLYVPFALAAVCASTVLLWVVATLALLGAIPGEWTTAATAVLAVFAVDGMLLRPRRLAVSDAGMAVLTRRSLHSNKVIGSAACADLVVRQVRGRYAQVSFGRSRIWVPTNDCIRLGLAYGHLGYGYVGSTDGSST